MALLRGGTLNTIAGSIGIKGDSKNILYNVADKYHHGEQFVIDRRSPMQVGDKYGFIFGNGVTYNFMEAYYSTGTPSPANGAKVLARTIFSALVGGPYARKMTRRVPVRVTSDGQVWAREDFLTICCGAIAHIGIGFKPWYRWNEQPGKFAALGIHCSPFRLVTDLWRILLGRPMRRDKAIDEVCAHLKMESDEPIGFILDGDAYPGDRVLEIKTGPKLDFIIR